MSGNPFDDLDGLDDVTGDDESVEDESVEDERADDEGADGEGADGAETPSSGDVPANRAGSSATEASSTRGPSTDAGAADAGSADATAEPSHSPDGPAFPYDDVKQRPLYAREEAWNAFEDALELEVERILREYDVRDAAGRELHDAALRVAADHPEAIAENLLELRGIDVNQ